MIKIIILILTNGGGVHKVDLWSWALILCQMTEGVTRVRAYLGYVSGRDGQVTITFRFYYVNITYG